MSDIVTGAKIKRAKAGNDAKRGKIWSKIARKIIIAARAGGGNPNENLTLRYTIDEARAENMRATRSKRPL